MIRIARRSNPLFHSLIGIARRSSTLFRILRLGDATIMIVDVRSLFEMLVGIGRIK